MKKKFAFIICCVFFSITTAMHFRSMHRYTLSRLSRTYDRVQNGKKFNDGYEKRSEFMDFAMKHIKNPKGIFVRYPRIKKTRIGDIANVGFLAFHFYPIPVFYLDSFSLKKCDYIITERHFGRMEELLNQQKEKSHFQEIAKSKRYVVFKRNKKMLNKNRQNEKN